MSLHFNIHPAVAGWSAVYEMGGAIHDEPLAAAHKRGVAANFAALHAAGAALRVAPMLSPEDYLQVRVP